MKQTFKSMKRLPLFKAKPFMLNVGPGNHKPIPLPIINKPKNILIGNSLTYTNNHLDIFNIFANSTYSSTVLPHAFTIIATSFFLSHGKSYSAKYSTPGF